MFDFYEQASYPKASQAPYLVSIGADTENMEQLAWPT